MTFKLIFDFFFFDIYNNLNKKFGGNLFDNFSHNAQVF